MGVLFLWTQGRVCERREPCECRVINDFVNAKSFLWNFKFWKSVHSFKNYTQKSIIFDWIDEFSKFKNSQKAQCELIIIQYVIRKNIRKYTPFFEDFRRILCKNVFSRYVIMCLFLKIQWCALYFLKIENLSSMGMFSNCVYVKIWLRYSL